MTNKFAAALAVVNCAGDYKDHLIMFICQDLNRRIGDRNMPDVKHAAWTDFGDDERLADLQRKGGE